MYELVALFAIIVLFLCALPYILLILLGIGIIALIVFVIYKIVQRRKAKNEERERCLGIINSEETAPQTIPIPTSEDFTFKEEERINQEFRVFLQQENMFLLAQHHYNFLLTKSKALVSLRRVNDATKLDSDISIAKTELDNAQAAKIKHNNETVALFYSVDEISEKFSALAKRLASEKVSLISDFFDNAYIKILKVDDSSALILFPCFLLHYSAKDHLLKLYKYSQVFASSSIFTSPLKGEKAPDDEVARVGYLHETKSGNRDMRYSLSNNPRITFVYRGYVTIRCGSLMFTQSFNNKSSTEAFIGDFKEYLDLINDKYEDVVQHILNCSSNIENAGSIEVFMEHQAEAEGGKTEYRGS